MQDSSAVLLQVHDSIRQVIMNYFHHIPTRMGYLIDEMDVMEESLNIELEQICDSFKTDIEAYGECDMIYNELIYVNSYMTHRKYELRRIMKYIKAEINGFITNIANSTDKINTLIDHVCLERRDKAPTLNRMPDFHVEIKKDGITKDKIGMVDSSGEFISSGNSLYDMVFIVEKRGWFGWGQYEGVSKMKLVDPSKLYFMEGVTEVQRRLMDAGDYSCISDKFRYYD